MAWSGWRKYALSSSVTLPSSASTRPSGVSTIGFTSTRVASSSANMAHSRSASTAACSAASAGMRPALTISSALAWSTPVSGETGTRAIASGLVCAISSISMPPSTVQMDMNVRFARSRRKER